MKPILISIFPGDTTFVLVAALLAIFGVIAIIRSNARTGARQRVAAVDIPLPTGAVTQITAANSHPRFSELIPDTTAFDMQPEPTGDTLAPATFLPESYAGPVVVEGSKYLWQSRWSHLPSFEQGREGEERVVNTLVNTLGEGWYIFRNFVLPTQNEDIDVVLVGPAGIFAMEVKAFSDEVKFERSRCYVRTAQGRFYRQRPNPNGQARHSAIKLNSYLKEHGITSKDHIKPMVVMAGDSSVEITSTRTDVCTLANLRPKLSNLTSETNLTSEQVRRIAGVLQASTSEQMRSGLSRVH